MIVITYFSNLFLNYINNFNLRYHIEYKINYYNNYNTVIFLLQYLIFILIPDFIIYSLYIRKNI